MNKAMKDLKEKFLNWMEALENKGSKVNIKKTKMMVSGSEGELFNSKIDSPRVCGRKMMANSVLCLKCGNGIYGRYRSIKRVTTTLATCLCLFKM